MELKWLGGGVLSLDRPVIMGVLNLTPDSFSDGGRWSDEGAAVGGAVEMVVEGARIVDVGGESTRPGAERVAAAVQIERIVGVIRGLRGELDRQGLPAAISVDTTLGPVAEAALEAGASMINDISAGRDDAGMFGLAARAGVPIVLMHMQGEPRTMQEDPRYDDVVGEVEGFLRERARAAMAAGVGREQILIDPGIGFGKTTAHNLTLLANLRRLVGLGFPVVLGASRKRFLGEVCRGAGGERPGAGELAAATCATTALGVAAGVSVFRVHDVRANWQAAQVAWTVVRGGVGGLL